MKLPSKVTLRKYGLTPADYQEIYERQQGKCPICLRDLDSGRSNIDHYHIKGWRKMEPEQRKLYVRGILSWQCNKFLLIRGIKADDLRRAAEYLDAAPVPQSTLYKDVIQK